MSDNNNVENDNESDYVYLKRPYLFNIRYNSRQVWNKLPDEEKAPYVNYEEYYEECRLIKLSLIHIFQMQLILCGFCGVIYYHQ